ncbi:MAG: hypothetical protein JNL57_07280 [Bacteroidetes bacterium]|nr:hypothetical protein [Bacteroidota bacterium]
MFHPLRHIFTGILLVLCSSVLNAQDDNSGDTAITRKRSSPGSQSLRNLSMGNDSFVPWDSAFPFVHRYVPALASAMPFADLGVAGSPQRNLFFSAEQAAGLQSGFNPYPFQNKFAPDFIFYKAAVPFTRFSYAQGGNGRTAFNGTHTQNFSPTWNVTADFSSISNNKIYAGSLQEHMHKSTTAGSRFKTQNGRFSQYLVVSWNRARRNENGGLSDDSLFFRNDTGTLFGKKNPLKRVEGEYDPMLAAAKSFYASRYHLVEHQFQPVRGKNLWLVHRLDWNKDKYQLKDSRRDTAYYGSWSQYATGFVNDSFAWSFLKNEAGIGARAVAGSTELLLRGTWGYEWSRYSAEYLYESIIQRTQALHGSVIANAPSWQAHVQADYYLSGYAQGDYKLAANARYTAGKLKAHAGLVLQQYHMPLMVNRFWNNSFDISNAGFSPANLQQLQAGVATSGSHIRAEGTIIAGTTNHLPYNYGSLNYQQAANLNFAQARVSAMFRLGRWHMDYRLVWQTFNKSEIISAPAIFWYSSWYYQGRVFKGAMLARLGADVWYTTKYDPYVYRADAAAFYPVKSNSKAGNYPMLDVYVSGEVKTVQIFVKLEHINNNLTRYGFNNQYFSALHYPLEPFRLRIGLSWKFFY